MSGEDSNLFLHSSLRKDFSSLGFVNFFYLPTLGKFVGLLVRKYFLHTTKAVLI